MNITSISPISRTNFGLVFHTCMNDPIKTTREFLTKHQPGKVTEWEGKLKELEGILPDDYIIFHKNGRVNINKNIEHKLDNNNNKVEKIYETLSRQTGIYLGRITHVKSNNGDYLSPTFNGYGVFLTSISDNILGNEALTSILNEIHNLKLNNKLPK